VAIESNCTGCGQKLSVADEHAGKRARCPACGQIYTVPFASTGSITPGPQSTPAAPGFGPTDSDLADEGLQLEPLNSQNDQFWMQTPDGNQYGPVDRSTLDRWFTEGRVGPGYKIRLNEQAWQAADYYRPAAHRPGNPYADNPYQPVAAAGMQGLGNFPKADQSVLILAMGILSFFLCPIFGIVAWIMGGTALKDIQAGRVDPRNKGLVQVGYYLGMVSVLLNILCIGGYVVIVAIALVAEGM
jgi:hypothetical protein